MNSYTNVDSRLVRKVGVVFPLTIAAGAFTVQLSKSHAKRVWGPQNFLGPKTLFTWDLHSQWMQILLKVFYGNKANFNKTIKKSKKGLAF